MGFSLQVVISVPRRRGSGRSRRVSATSLCRTSLEVCARRVVRGIDLRFVASQCTAIDRDLPQVIAREQHTPGASLAHDTSMEAGVPWRGRDCLEALVLMRRSSRVFE
jgi:hypothetical protein